MAKNAIAVRQRAASRNWIAYLCESLVTSEILPTWEAATYLTENLFGEKPNPRLLGPSDAHRITAEFLHRLYQPIVEAASRQVNMAASSLLHIFTNVSLTGNSAVLVVLFPGPDQPEELILLDAAKAWDLVFPDADSFNAWAEDRYHRVVQGLLNASVACRDVPATPAM
jgi:hypothetical protein